MEKRNNQTTGGIGCSGVLFLIFLVLKLTGLISWSWWWVTSPLWIGLVLVVLVLAIMLVTFLIKEASK